MKLNEKMKKVLSYAEQYHKDQKYGNKPYSYHLLGVAERASDIFKKNYGDNDSGYEDLITVALLHDIVEDTMICVCDLQCVFGDVIAFAIRSLTHAKGQSYVSYIENMQTRFVVIVKLADLDFNITHSRMELSKKYNGYANQRMEKYLLASYILRTKLSRLG